MKIKTLIAYFIFTCAISSCIQDEALNSEAAIDVCSGNDCGKRSRQYQGA